MLADWADDRDSPPDVDSRTVARTASGRSRPSQVAAVHPGAILGNRQERFDRDRQRIWK